MSRTVLVFEDDAGGGIQFKVTHVGGWNPKSPACKLANQTVKWLDERATRCTDLVATELPVSDLKTIAPEPAIVTPGGARG